MSVFKVNDLELTERILEAKAAHSLACGYMRTGELSNMLTELARVEDAARKAGWRVMDLLAEKRRVPK